MDVNFAVRQMSGLPRRMAADRTVVCDNPIYQNRTNLNTLYADIVIPVAKDAFTFAVGDVLRTDIREGRCVKVQLGPSKYYMGIVWRLHGERPPYKTIKSVDSYVENSPLLSARQMRFWEWIASYYMCTLGEVMRAALPSALKPEGFSHEQFSLDTYRPPTVQYISLHPSIVDEQALSERFESLQRAKKQYEALIELAGTLGDESLFGGEIPRQRLRTDMTILRKLAQKNVIVIRERELTPGELPPLPSRLPELTPEQRRAAGEIRESFETKDVVLLHGVTGSGKTEIYINLIAGQLAAGRNVLYLLPEIAMTSQLIERVRSWFGERVVTYHSKFTSRHRVEAYRRLNRSRGGEVILGVRSALFLPVENLGLVVVDEEHDPSYKQADSAPRYHARDSAIVLAKAAGAKVLLGSATPSIESYANAAEGKYGLATLTERYGGVPMPRMIVSDTLKAVKRGERTAHFNKSLLERIDVALSANKQVMLFQNRRGFSPYMECAECGSVVMCRQCNVAMTYHKSDGMLRCHYCGQTRKPPVNCPTCNEEGMQTRGFGTEKVEEELYRIFPQASIERLDRDTATSVTRYNSIIASFESGTTDILVGTQMITKGFDFAGVSLVGILNADNLLGYPDFRAAERAYQLLVQVGGRAGRRDQTGEVVIQTSQPDNAVLRQAASGDYQGMVRGQLSERADFFYPPYCRIVEVTVKHRNRETLWNGANMAATEGRKVFGRLLLGPQPPLVDKIRGEYLLTFMLKVERGTSFAQAKAVLRDIFDRMLADPRYKYLTVTYNVDPQ